MLNFAADLQIFFNLDEFAAQGLHHRSNVVFRCIVDVLDEYIADGRVLRKMANMVYKLEDLTLATGDIVTFAGKEWTVANFKEQDKVVGQAELRSKEGVTL